MVQTSLYQRFQFGIYWLQYRFNFIFIQTFLGFFFFFVFFARLNSTSANPPPPPLLFLYNCGQMSLYFWDYTNRSGQNNVFWLSFGFLLPGLKEACLVTVLALFENSTVWWKRAVKFSPWIMKRDRLSPWCLRELLQYHVTLCILQIFEPFHNEAFLVTGSIKERSILLLNIYFIKCSKRSPTNFGFLYIKWIQGS